MSGMLESLRNFGWHVGAIVGRWGKRFRSPRPAIPIPPAKTEAPLARSEKAATHETELPHEREREPGNGQSRMVVRKMPTDGDLLAGNIGEFRFRETILDDLDHYRRYLARLKSSDREAYELFSRMGMVLSSRHGMFDAKEPEKMLRGNIPTFGAVVLGDDAMEDDDNTIKFIYFTKYEKNAPGIEPAPGMQAFSVNVVFDYDGKRYGEKYKLRRPAIAEFGVAIDQNGTIRLLRTLIRSRQVIPFRRGQHRGSSAVITHQRWGVSPFITRLAERRGITPTEAAVTIFSLAVNAWVSISDSTIRVHAQRDGLAAVFAVDMLRTPQFFNDREPVFTKTGRKARIFHIVRAHPRTLPNGKVIGIKTHFAGLRRFSWNGHEVSISVPGREHFSLSEFTVPCIDGSSISPREYRTRKYLKTSAIAARLLQAVEQGRGAHVSTGARA